LFAQVTDPDSALFSAALNACSKALAYREAQRIWSEMPQEMKDVVAYSTMIDLCKRRKLVDQAESLFNEMKRLGVQPNAITYASMIGAYGMTGQPSRALDIFEEVKATVWEQVDVVSKEMLFLAVMIAFARTGDYARTRELFVMMIQGGISPNHAHVNALLSSCAMFQHADIARQIFNGMAQWGLKPRVEDYSILLSCCKGDLPSCKDIFDEMLRVNIQPNGIAYMNMLEAYVVARDAEGGRAIVAAAGSSLDRQSTKAQRVLDELQSLQHGIPQHAEGGVTYTGETAAALTCSSAGGLHRTNAKTYSCPTTAREAQ